MSSSVIRMRQNRVGGKARLGPAFGAVVLNGVIVTTLALKTLEK